MESASRLVSELPLNCYRLEQFTIKNGLTHISRVYCKFHYMEFKSFKNSEEELLYFLGQFTNPNWSWMEQYKADVDNDEDEENRMK